MTNTEKELKRLLKKQLEENAYHLSMEEEFGFYNKIANGDLSVLEMDLSAEPFPGMGRLSDNNLRNAKYHLIILISMITRMCIESGLSSEEAYTLSDMFIRQVDVAINVTQLSQIKREAVTQFTKTMHDLVKQSISSLFVMKAIEYIDKHLTEPISVTAVAEFVNLNPDYLSKLFKSETHQSLNRYILERKCHTARYMLENSTISCTDIAAFLGFSSASHFIERFKQIEGITPIQYRKREQIKHMPNNI